jgi:phosphohistidine phosphatase
VELYFLRHGRSVARSQWTEGDDTRPLTDDGKVAMAHEAATFARLGLRPDIVISSPLTRALQTAEIAVTGMGIPERLEVSPDLASGFGSKRLSRLLRVHSDAGRIMLVGHEPDMSATIEKLTGARVVFSKGGAARIDVETTGTKAARLVWLLQGETLDGASLAAEPQEARASRANADKSADEPPDEAGERPESPETGQRSHRAA